MKSETTNPSKMIAGFWIRAAADALDMAILWIFAFGLSFMMEGWFVRLGEKGVWVGLLISIAYFVPLQSRLGKGQSLGKRLLRIQVLDRKGEPLSLIKSFLRYLVIAFVAYIGVFIGVVNLIAGPSLASLSNSVMGTLWFVAFFGCYLLLPLHPLKRGLHDLVADSVVVYRGTFNATALAARENPAKARKALTVVGAFSVLVILIGVWSFRATIKEVPLENLLAIQAKLESTGKFHSTTVMDNVSSNKSGTTRMIIVQAHVDGPFDQGMEELKPAYDLAFLTIRDHIKDLSLYDHLRVGLRLGYNLGIRKRYIIRFQDENSTKPGERRDAGTHSDF